MADVDIPTPEAPVQDTPSAAGGGGNWLDSVPETYRDSGFVTKYGSQEEFFKGMDNLSRLAGQKQAGLVAPGEGASDEELAAFDASLRNLSGVPESLDDYTAAIELPQLGEGNMMGRFLEMGHKAGVAPKAMQSIITGLAESISAEEKAAMDAYDKQTAAAMDSLKKDWADDYDYNMNIAERFASELSDETLTMLKEARWNNNAPLVRDLYNLGNKFLGEGDLAQVSRTAGGEVTEKAIEAMMSDPRYTGLGGVEIDPDYVKMVKEKILEFHSNK